MNWKADLGRRSAPLRFAPGYPPLPLRGGSSDNRRPGLDYSAASAALNSKILDAVKDPEQAMLLPNT